MLWTVCPDISDWCFFLRQASAYPKLYALMHNTPNLNNQFLRGTSTRSNVLKTATDSIATHHSVITKPHVTSQLVNRAITSELSNTKLTADLKETTVTGTATGQSLSSGGTTHNLKVEVVKDVKSDNGSAVTSVRGESTHYWVGDDDWSWATPNVGSSSGTFVKSITVSKGSQNVDGKVSLTGNAKDSALKNTKVVNGRSEGSLLTGHATGFVTNGNVTGTIDSTDVLYTGKKNTYSGRDETAPMHMFVRFLIRAAE